MLVGNKACAELRFILLMLHGIHPIEDSEADKLLRSSAYQRSIIGNETTRPALRSETSQITVNNKISETQSSDVKRSSPDVRENGRTLDVVQNAIGRSVDRNLSCRISSESVPLEREFS